jgi:glycosyltransferase involved in cell wall biosynthesis
MQRAPDMPDAHHGRSKPIRVAIFQPSLPLYRIPVFQKLSESDGIDLTVFASPRQKKSSLPEAFEKATFNAQPVPMKTVGPFLRQPSQIHELEPDRFDVVIFSWNVRNLDLSGAVRRAHALRIPVALWGHGFSKHEAGWRRWLRNRVARRADALILYNHSAAKRLRDEGFDENRLFVALNALDQNPIRDAQHYWKDRPEEFAAHRSRNNLDDRPVVLFISRLELDKRVDWLIGAFARVREEIPNARLVIIGDGSARESLVALADSAGLSDEAVTFTGSIYDERLIAPWMMSASLCCFPTEMGLSILHAFGYGLPVIASDAFDSQGPEIEALRPGENGLTYHHGDVSHLAEQMGALLRNDNDQRSRMSGEALATVENTFTIDRMVDGFLRCIHALAAGKNEA